MSFHLNVRWGPRAEPLSACAARLARTLGELAAVHPNLAHWKQQAKTRSAADKPFCATPPSPTELEDILSRGRHFTDVGRKPMPELGHSVAAWNGLDTAQSVSLHLSVNVTYKPWLYPNNVGISGLTSGNELVDEPLLKRMLLSLAQCWDADWGAVDTWAYKGPRRDLNNKPLLPYGGWLTYLSPTLAGEIASPADVDGEQTFDGGLLMSVSKEPLDISNPAHIARLDAVQKSLAPVQRSTTVWYRQFFPDFLEE
jgi:hypothetical protein